MDVDVAGDVTASTAGMMAGFGSGGADEGAAGCVPEITGADDAPVEVRVPEGTIWAAENALLGMSVVT